ncbi:MAG: metallophosphoesterase [Bacteroides sp.]|nr:metallophosphoesterase [Bacteroides sp.]
MTRITVTLIEIVLVVTLGVACSHSGLPAIPSAPDTTTPSNTGGKEDNTDSPAYDITPPASDATIYGRVSTVNGTPVENVVVSDGISVAVTDANGCYSINSDKSKGYIFISVPGNFTPEINGNIPQICKKLTLSKSQLEIHDFTLTPTDNTAYTLLISADQHIANRTDDLLQLQTFVLPDVNATIAAEKNRGRNVYSLSLGDISWEQFWTANSFGLTDAVKCFSYLECPTYHSIGNHDNNPYVSDDWISSAVFRNNIAPTYYSFNIGKVHFVVLDNVIYNNPNATSSQMGYRTYDRALTEDQLQWLSADLSTIKDKSAPLVICAHVPFYADPTLSGGKAVTKRNMLNMDALENILEPFTNITLFSGHYHRNYTVISPYNSNIKECNVASLSGSLWWTARPGYSEKHLCTDGSPGGYGILRVNGSDLDFIYKGIGYDEQEQFRIYDLNTTVINESSVTGSKKYKEMVKDYAGDYYSPAKENGILVNVFSWQPDWKIEIIENGIPLEVKRVRVKDPLHILAYECQRLSHNAVPTSTVTLTTQNSSHFFRAKGSKADSEITVKVTDNKGRIYKSTIQRPYTFSLSAY